ncbi:MAG: FHA domain-containing protein [Planctomycetota bacterium]
MPYLINVAGSRIPLRRGHTYSLGRGRDCDIVIPDGGCSRRHATVTVANLSDHVYIDDADSRNGTYLNGRPVDGPTVVPNGGRLRIGASIFLMQLAEMAEISDLEETCTTTAEGIDVVRDIDGGELSSLGLLETLRLLVTARRSVTMHVAMPTAAARVDVRGGEILSARHGGLDGFEALVKLGRETAGIFWLVDASGPCPQNIREPSSHVLFELSRLLDRVNESVRTA